MKVDLVEAILVRDNGRKGTQWIVTLENEYREREDFEFFLGRAYRTKQGYPQKPTIKQVLEALRDDCEIALSYTSLDEFCNEFNPPSAYQKVQENLAKCRRLGLVELRMRWEGPK